VVLATDEESGLTDRRQALDPRSAQIADTGTAGGFKRALAAIFLGDWHPLLRDPLDLFRLSFLVGAVVFAVQGDWDAVVRLLIPCLLVFLIRALELPRPIDWSAASPPSTIELPAMASVTGDPEARPVPRTAYGTVRSSAPIAMAAAKARGRTGEAPAA
jgi:hypothetical protein